jgi:hypothetical protein|tara:strand:+ start:531 stop:848 length:318 start_codon:yes stop_codon:yes gene_type:complete
MEAKRLVPYSVHLREDIYLKLKEAAGQRKATALVRDAITLIVEGDDVFNGGYNKGLRDAIAVIQENESASSISVGGESIADILSAQIEGMILNQSVGGKHGAKKV